MRVASAPVSFGVDEVMMDDAWMPTPDDMLDWMVDIGYEGTELGPPGFLGDAGELRQRLSSRGLAFIGSFMPQHFSRSEKADTDRAWLRENLKLVRDGAPAGSQPLAILSDHFDEPDRLRWSGRIAAHPETWLSAERFEVFMDNLHRAAEICREEGLEPVLHPHAGTYVETADEIARVMDRIDPSLVGLCLDTGHFRFGGADPARSSSTTATSSAMSTSRIAGRRSSRGSMATTKASRRPSSEACSARSARATSISRRSSPRSAAGTTAAGWSSSRTRRWARATRRPSVIAGQRFNLEYLRRMAADVPAG
jgi:sugar phosphate isomerase/epimerase